MVAPAKTAVKRPNVRLHCNECHHKTFHKLLKSTSDEGSEPYFRAGAMAAYRMSSAWAIRADLGLGLALDPPAFEWTGAVAAVAFRPSVLSGRAALGAEVRF